MGRSNTYKANEYDSFLTTGYVENNHHYFMDINGNRRADSQIGITTSMFVHPAYMDLSSKDKAVYQLALYQYRNAPYKPSDKRDDEKYKGKSGKRYIFLNENLAVNVFRVCKSNATLRKCLKSLAEHGFLIPVERPNHQEYIYELSSAWKEYAPGMIYQETNTNKHTWEWVRVQY